MNNDPWKHRSKGIRCNTCMWFSIKKPDNLDQEYEWLSSGL